MNGFTTSHASGMHGATTKGFFAIVCHLFDTRCYQMFICNLIVTRRNSYLPTARCFRASQVPVCCHRISRSWLLYEWKERGVNQLTGSETTCPSAGLDTRFHRFFHFLINFAVLSFLHSIVHRLNKNDLIR